MTEKTTHLVANLTFFNEQPTTVLREALFNWILWQFPALKQGNLCGAIHPPLAGHGWLPVIIHIHEKKVQVFAHLDLRFDSPETAVEYFNSV
ncbi:MAG: hypothetical protein IAE79_26760 [Anaerolinea sp.]|nr:hypothetical protein [Anaerolinea sp.]